MCTALKDKSILPFHSVNNAAWCIYTFTNMNYSLKDGCSSHHLNSQDCTEQDNRLWTSERHWVQFLVEQVLGRAIKINSITTTSLSFCILYCLTPFPKVCNDLVIRNFKTVLHKVLELHLRLG